MTDFFTAVGFIVVASVTIAMVLLLICGIKQFIEERIWNYKYNHRFDKPPTAKCYCKDCSLYGDFTSRSLCRKHKSHFSEDYFLQRRGSLQSGKWACKRKDIRGSR